MGVLGRLVRDLPVAFFPLPLCLLLLSCLRLFCFLCRSERGALASLCFPPVGLGLPSGTEERALDEEAPAPECFLFGRPGLRLPPALFFLGEAEAGSGDGPEGASTLIAGGADGAGAGAVVGVPPSSGERQDDLADSKH